MVTKPLVNKALRTLSWSRPQPPSVTLVDGQVSVRFPLRLGADLTAVIVDVVSRLSTGATSPAVRDGDLTTSVGIF